MLALNVSGDHGVNLLVIIVSVVSLLLLEANFGRIYKKSVVDKIEMTCYVNIGTFSAIKLKVGSGKFVDATAYVSGAITIVLLTVVIIYHVYTEFYSKRCMLTRKQVDESEEANEDLTDFSKGVSDIKKPTFSVMELGLPHGDGQRPARMETTDNASIISTDSMAPLLDEHN